MPSSDVKANGPHLRLLPSFTEPFLLMVELRTRSLGRVAPSRRDMHDCTRTRPSREAQSRPLPRSGRGRVILPPLTRDAARSTRPRGVLTVQPERGVAQGVKVSSIPFERFALVPQGLPLPLSRNQIWKYRVSPGSKKTFETLPHCEITFS